jgi:hypothetical protein
VSRKQLADWGMTTKANIDLGHLRPWLEHLMSYQAMTVLTTTLISAQGLDTWYQRRAQKAVMVVKAASEGLRRVQGPLQTKSLEVANPPKPSFR